MSHQAEESNFPPKDCQVLYEDGQMISKGNWREKKGGGKEAAHQEVGQAIPNYT